MNNPLFEMDDNLNGNMTVNEVEQVLRNTRRQVLVEYMYDLNNKSQTGFLEAENYLREEQNGLGDGCFDKLGAEFNRRGKKCMGIFDCFRTALAVANRELLLCSMSWVHFQGQNTTFKLKVYMLHVS